jgi:hypothetical protein
MAQQIYAMNMQDTIFPLLSEQQTRTIMGASIGQAPAEAVRPGVAYMHNVMPTKYGMNSVSYTQIAAGTADPNIPSSFFTDVRLIFSATDNSRTYLGLTVGGGFFSLSPGANSSWYQISKGTVNFPAPFNSEFLTIATVNGRSYMFYKGYGMFEYRSGLNGLVGVSTTGLATADVLGMVSSNGYLIAYTKSALAWSSTIDPTDFVPSQVTGSGGGNVAEIDGDILFVTSNSLGILIYTFNNIIAGTYTGNALYPFKFRVVENSKGGVSLNKTAYEANAANQFVYSKAGLMTVSSQKADTILPEITDFLAGNKFEDFNEVTKLLIQTDIPQDEQMLKQIKYVASRYLVVSYGLIATGLTHALVIDTSMAKVGKLKIPHVDVFEYVGPVEDAAKDSMAFLKDTGEVVTVNFSTTPNSVGVLIMGKLQATLTRNTGLLKVQVENVRIGDDIIVMSSASFDGKNFTNVTGTLINDNASNIIDYNFRSSAKSHNIILIGSFNLVTLLVTYRVEGRR